MGCDDWGNLYRKDFYRPRLRLVGQWTLAARREPRPPGLLRSEVAEDESPSFRLKIPIRHGSHLGMAIFRPEARDRAGPRFGRRIPIWRNSCPRPLIAYPKNRPANENPADDDGSNAKRGFSNKQSMASGEDGDAAMARKRDGYDRGG